MVHPSWLEIAILAILLCVSGSLFWLRFRKAVDAIRRARDESRFSSRPLGPRIRQFVWEVLLQGKVIRERPLPGLAHAFVFWGFCAFALVTLNHFAAGFGFPFLEPRRRIRPGLFRFRGRLRRGRGGFHRRPGHPPLRRAPALAGQGLAGIRRHRAADLRADGHLSGRACGIGRELPQPRASTGGRTRWRCSSFCR